MKKAISLIFILLFLFSAGYCQGIERAYNPWPGDGSTNVSIYTDLAWDHDGESSSLYLGTNPDRLYRQLSYSTSKRYNIYGNLRPGQRYYWKVDVHEGDTTVPGKIWTFRTRSTSMAVVVGCHIHEQMNMLTIMMFLLPVFFIRHK